MPNEKLHINYSEWLVLILYKLYSFLLFFYIFRLHLFYSFHALIFNINIAIN